MMCPSCGGSNFAWARQCDHCGRPLRGDSRSSTPGLTQPDRQVEHQELDLRTHALEDVPGKTVAINGVRYTILKSTRVSRQPNVCVFPLRHQTTLMVHFELKVFRCTPGSAAYESVKARGLRTFREKAPLSTDKDPGAVYFVIEEIYEQNGGLLGLQRAFTDHPGPAYHAARMARAISLLNEGRHVDAIREFDRILELNPNHNAALCNKGVCLARSGDVSGAVDLFSRCIELDANDPAPYQNAALFLSGSGRVEAATKILKKSLNRYAGDFGTWMLLIRIAIENDTLDLVHEIVESGMTLIADTEIGGRLRPELERSRARWIRYCAALEQAIPAQMSQAWDDAVRLLDQTIPLSRRNALAELNRCICLFHKNEIEASVQGLRQCAHRLDGNAALAAALLLLLGSADLGKWDVARGIALGFHRRVETVSQLPRIPVVVKHAQASAPAPMFFGADCIEDPRIGRIVSTLSKMPAFIQCDAADVKALDELRERYEQLAAMSFPALEPRTPQPDTGSSKPH
jgi:tetratricopeptide (TPR) repeat protein